ncbi:hypothetical protein [Flavobacterium sp. H122]|uniref:hypothetical protein n=1 Tax=Flavobacterium sp. H122 TaxID=2529860 RepID=UPI0010AA1B72|nr:hypothetical protein [Flavobacterium sp. H122]
MKKINLLLMLFCLNFGFIVQAQDKTDKKVAVVSFYTDKTIGVSELGLEGVKGLADKIFDLKNNPNFNLTPLLEKYHTAFFDNYSKKFPFAILPEAEVTGNKEYIDFKPRFEEKDTESINGIINYNGYKHIYEGMFGKVNEEGIAKVFSTQANGVLFTQIHFSLVKNFGIGGMATVKMRAFVRMALYDSTGKKVWSITEGANSKETSVMVGGIPVMSVEKIQPMCESALEQLLKDLDGRMEKIIKKTDGKI